MTDPQPLVGITLAACPVCQGRTATDVKGGWVHLDASCGVLTTWRG